MAFSWSLVTDGSSCSSIHRTRNLTHMHASIYCPLVIILRRNTLLGDVTRNRKVWIDRLQHVQLKIHIWKFQRYSLKTVSTASLTLLRAASRRSWAPVNTQKLGLARAEYCPHWLAVVGSNHHSAFSTSTQLTFNSIYSIFTMGESPFS